MEKVFKFFTTFHFHTVRARAHIQPNNIINFHGFLVITIIKFPRRIAARFIGELLRGELTSVVGRDGTGYRSPGAANWKQYRACLSDVERVENREATRGFHERKCSFPRRNENFGRLQVFQALDLENVARWRSHLRWFHRSKIVCINICKKRNNHVTSQKSRVF